MINFKDLDKSDFECWQIEGGSVYYGQVSYVDQNNKIVEDIEEAKRVIQEEAENMPEGEEPPPEPTFKRVRHGLGIN